MLGPLLGGNASKQPAKESEADKMARCISQNSGLTEYVNKMKISETGKRSKLSNDSAASSTSQMSIGSAVSPVHMTTAQACPIQHGRASQPHQSSKQLYSLICVHSLACVFAFHAHPSCSVVRPPASDPYSCSSPLPCTCRCPPSPCRTARCQPPPQAHPRPASHPCHHHPSRPPVRP